MKVISAALLVGVTAAAVPPAQQFLGVHHQDAETSSSPLQSIREHLKSISDDAHDLWSEATSHVPDVADYIPFSSSPKSFRRRPDSHWDHIVRGSDVQSLWVTNADGQKEREIGGRLEAYDLRVKKVDPSVLNIDPGVKQYSGYLDDNESDKHLFYC